MNFKHEICFRTKLISSLKLDVVTRESALEAPLVWTEGNSTRVLCFYYLVFFKGVFGTQETR